MNQPKPSTSKAGVKTKKQPKMKSKSPAPVSAPEQPSTSSNTNEKDKGSPSKDFQDYAGISSDSLWAYAEKSSYEHLSEEVCNILTEDINYKLRYIIHNSLIKAKLQGREVITADDVDETFSNLRIDKVYGASSNPNWIPNEDNSLYTLEDQKINLIELSEEETSYGQEGDVILDTEWLQTDSDSEEESDENTEVLSEYFEAMCAALISNDEHLRNTALLDITENASIGPITDWFYHFSYFLLMKNTTHPCITSRALQLLEVLENSPLPSLHIYGKQLKLLVRLLLQRLLIFTVAKDVLKPMCYVLSLLCLRVPLKQMVLSKLEDKFQSVCDIMTVPLLYIIYFLGIDAVSQIFLPNMKFFLDRTALEEDGDMEDVVLAIYGLLCKANLNKRDVYTSFEKVFGDRLVPYWLPKYSKLDGKDDEKMEVDFVNMKTQLMKNRRKVDCRQKKIEARPLEEVFTIPTHNCRVRRDLDNHRSMNLGLRTRKDTHITVGKTSLLLSILKGERRIDKCMDHSLLPYTL